MFKMFNLFTWVTDLVENFTFYGGGKGGSTSTSTTKDYFGVGKRAPYEEVLRSLLLGGPIGGTAGRYENTGNKNSSGRGAWIPGTPGLSIADFIKQTPGYQFGMDQGQEALERSFAARGFGPSGYQDIALQNFGQQYANQQYQQLIGNLMNPAGVNMMGTNTTSTSSNSMLGGILGIGAAMLGNPFAIANPTTMGATVSDKNLKTNIKHINTINGIKIYSFNYIWSKIKTMGVMAQDLLEMPEYKHAVGMNSMGYTVDYSKLPI